MSYHVWPVAGYGLIYQGGEELKDILKQFSEDEDNDYDAYDVVDIGGHVVDDECDGKFSTNLDGENENEDPWIWFSCKKRVSPTHQAYSSWEEMAQEFLDSYSDTLKLPPLDNKEWWLQHLGYVEYTQGG